jgi:hypothetical protein
MPLTTCHSKPPLLQTYTAPSGPIAAPLGPPRHSPTTSTRPSGSTLERVPRWISTRITEPSSIAIGPSGNCKPLAISRIAAIGSPLRSGSWLEPGDKRANALN